MEPTKAVLFGFWGVTVPSSPDAVFASLEKQQNLPEGFLSSLASRKDGALSRAERGKVTLFQMIPDLEVECVEEARARAISLPSGWSVRHLVDKLREAMLDVNPAVLKMAARLRDSGYLTAVLANHWIYDSGDTEGPARLLSQLGGHFDLVLQSCRTGHRVPEASMFSSAVQHLGVTLQQALWVDADEDGVKAAEREGMKTILVENGTDALSKLASLAGLQVVDADSKPPSCKPNEVSHGYVTIRPGVRTHYVEMGEGPPVLLCHGFPESWYSWRYQIPALAHAGFRVLALDMKGYGESTAPTDISEYSQEQMCKDLIVFLDKMAIPQVTLVGHDWGGALVWSMAQVYPERVRAVVSLNTPLFDANPAVLQKIQDLGIFDYQVYFQKPGVAEAELEKNLERTFKIFFSSSCERDTRPPISTAGVCARGGLFVGQPEDIPLTSMLTEADLQFYMSRYKDQGFRRPLNWYRAMGANMKWTSSRPNHKVLVPALMVTAGHDPVLLPSFSEGMEDLIPNLSRGHIEECGHWTQLDRPAETNRILIGWLKETHGKAKL
eukprot:XP_003966690.1 PREDICTED: bifunctional epoxide hydrolase 2 [Takifugu rubripes]